MNFVNLVLAEHIICRIGVLRVHHYGADNDVIYGIGASDDKISGVVLIVSSCVLISYITSLSLP